ncbi:MAG TPA: hypothetical protein VFQ68_16700 [Streptosporangiaceae bacterium]|nr:hypothetical protein [Streptosporangiaceae bacterium]
MTEMTGAARVVMLDRRRPGDIAERSGDPLDVTFGWPDFARAVAGGHARRRAEHHLGP